MKEINSVIEAEAQAIQLQQQFATVVITDQETYDKAVAARVDGKAWLKNANDWFDSIQKPAYEAYKGILDKRKQVCDPVDQQLAAINKALVKWNQEQQELRLAEQRRLEAEAREKAEEERLAQAVELEEAGVDKESVEEFLATPVAITTPVLAAPTYQKSSAVVMRDNWSAQVTDLFALVKAVAKDKSKLNLLQVNQTSLNQMAKALKETMNIPGVRPVNNRVAASGRG